MFNSPRAPWVPRTSKSPSSGDKMAKRACCESQKTLTANFQAHTKAWYGCKCLDTSWGAHSQASFGQVGKLGSVCVLVSKAWDGELKKRLQITSSSTDHTLPPWGRGRGGEKEEGGREGGREGCSGVINITGKLNLKDLGDIKQDNYLYQDSVYYLQSELVVFFFL